jgi:ankyrin repeat protein
MHAWREMLNRPGSRRATRLSKLFDNSRLRTFDFSKLHRAYLGLSGDDFPAVLSSIDRAEIDVKDSTSRTTLSWAAARGDQDAVRKLLACGADPNAADDNGRTPLHWTAWSTAKSNCMQQLLKADACVNAQDDRGESPRLQMLMSNREISET